MKIQKIGQSVLFTLPPTQGLTGSEWIQFLVENDFFINSKGLSEKDLKSLKPTKGVEYTIAVFPCVKEDDETLDEMYKKSIFTDGMNEANVEMACMFRRYVSNNLMNRYIPASAAFFIHFVTKKDGVYHSYDLGYGFERSIEVEKRSADSTVGFDYTAFPI
jgi:hypothetical protein